jgi:hypothetical protein
MLHILQTLHTYCVHGDTQLQPSAATCETVPPGARYLVLRTYPRTLCCRLHINKSAAMTDEEQTQERPSDSEYTEEETDEGVEHALAGQQSKKKKKRKVGLVWRPDLHGRISRSHLV